jgi:hypothetical protein
VPAIPSVGDPVPDCPVCDGPCTHEFERSDLRIPDRLPKANTTRPDGVDEPAREPKPNRRGKRSHRPAEDRMHRPSEDRSR